MITKNIKTMKTNSDKLKNNDAIGRIIRNWKKFGKVNENIISKENKGLKA